MFLKIINNIINEAINGKYSFAILLVGILQWVEMVRARRERKSTTLKKDK